MKTLITAGCVVLVVAGIAEAVKTAGFERYQVILQRQPFGEPPPPEIKQDVVPDTLHRPTPVSFTKDLRLCAIVDSAFGIRIGFLSIAKKSQKSYYLRPGESEDGIEVVRADYARQRVLLRQGGKEEWLTMGTSDFTEDTSKPEAVAAAAKARAKARSFTSRRRGGRELIRHRKVKPPKVTGEELREHLRNYQMELIRAGGQEGPPLPIPLTPEMDDQLVSEGVLPPLEQGGGAE